jgi:hypothetical protein
MPSGRSSANVIAQILGVQCFLARTALGWSVSQLGRAAEIMSRTTVTENQKWRREAALAGCRVMAAKIALPHRRRQGWRSTALEAMGIGRANVYRAL